MLVRRAATKKYRLRVPAKSTVSCEFGEFNIQRKLEQVRGYEQRAAAGQSNHAALLLLRRASVNPGWWLFGLS